jgi:hypothetical protein
VACISSLGSERNRPPGRSGDVAGYVLASYYIAI